MFLFVSHLSALWLTHYSDFVFPVNLSDNIYSSNKLNPLMELSVSRLTQWNVSQTNTEILYMSVSFFFLILTDGRAILNLMKGLQYFKGKVSNNCYNNDVTNSKKKKTQIQMPYKYVKKMLTPTVTPSYSFHSWQEFVIPRKQYCFQRSWNLWQSVINNFSPQFLLARWVEASRVN